jgi:hypothetical protein
MNHYSTHDTANVLYLQVAKQPSNRIVLSTEQHQGEGEKKTATLVEGSSVGIVPLLLIDHHAQYAFQK